MYHYYYCPYPHQFPDIENKDTLSFNGTKLEKIVSEEIIKVVQPYAIEAAMIAEQKHEQANNEKLNYISNSIEQAKYDAQRIERQYNKVEPENRLVASTLEQRWQKSLQKLNELQEQYDALISQQQKLTAGQREQLFELANNLPRVWHDPKCNYREKTRLVRLLIKEIWVERLNPTKLKAIIHWHGGVHTSYEFSRRPRPNKEQQEVVITADIIRQLAKTCDDEQIVRILNRANYRPEKSAKHVSWTKTHVEQIRYNNDIPEFSIENYKLLGIVNLQQASEILDTSMETVSQLIAAKLIKAKQVIKYAPWEIAKSELDKPEVGRYLRTIQKGKKKSLNKNQLDLL